MSLAPILIGLFIVSALCLLTALAHGVSARRHWRQRRRMAASYRGLWSLVFLSIGLFVGLAGATMLGYRRLTDEALIAKISTHQIGPQRYKVDVSFADGGHRDVQLTGDQWQLDAHVIKWKPRAVMLGAPALFEVQRISGRYRSSDDEREREHSAFDFHRSSPFDLWSLKQRFPAWLPWIDANFGSAAYMPLLDGGDFTVSLAPAGGLIARPADAATAEKLAASGL